MVFDCLLLKHPQIGVPSAKIASALPQNVVSDALAIIGSRLGITGTNECSVNVP